MNESVSYIEAETNRREIGLMEDTAIAYDSRMIQGALYRH